MQNLIMNNITLDNNVFTGTGTAGVFYIQTIDRGNVTVNGLQILNTYLSYRSLLNSVSFSSNSLDVRKVYFKNVTMVSYSTMIKATSLLNMSIADMSFYDVNSENSNDSTNLIIGITEIN